MIELVNVSKIYRLSDREVMALDSVNLTIQNNDYVSIVGHSGSGKSTLLNILAGYESIDDGQYYYNSFNVSKFSKNELNKFNKKIGFIFQDYQLLNYMPVKENILLGSIYTKKRTNKNKLINIAKKLKIDDLLNKYPWQLSGGEKQRVAIARILLTKKTLILADEPTGALDKENALMIMSLFEEMHNNGMTIILVTHDEKVAACSKRIIRMENGHVLT
ncbi:MAG: ABC transporter ATP-binding protein [Erysipelotrichia bacterium]|nr:ABC transporter ATP-binding protein [Erysipelotrichia bacterium]